MPSLGKSINLYLMDGTASGRWEAKLSNWNGVAYKIPRTDMRKCSDLPELRSPGVYFLFGQDDESGRQFVYVGEADDVLKRLQQPHTFEKDGTYWTEAVTFVTPDGTLEKGRVKYLESRFHAIATEANRFVVKNGNTPPQSPIGRQIQDMLEEFILNAQLLLPALGYKVFEALPPADSDDNNDLDDLFYFSRSKGKGGQATGRLSSDGFWVLKGSYIYPEVKSYTAPGIKKARQKHASDIDKNNILQVNVCFGSPSYAAAFVCGKNSNGLLEWKNKNGVSLKDLDVTSQTSAKESTATVQNNPGAAPSKIAPAPDASALLHLAGKKVSATGWISKDGFTVSKGSGFSLTETKSCKNSIRNMRSRLMQEGKVKDSVFLENVQFGSPSTAASCILGGAVNGNKMWINSDGVVLKDAIVPGIEEQN